MPADELVDLAEALNSIAKLYQFRSLDRRLYGTLTVSQSYCLHLLYFQGPCTMNEIAKALQITLSTTTGVIDQLEKKKLVRRIDHPRDRRSLHAELTPPGRKLYRSAHHAFLSHIVPLWERRTPSQRKEALRFLRETEQALRGWIENPRKVKVKSDDKDHSQR
jgi:DNA-binding MarR family transcriptional regulator